MRKINSSIWQLKTGSKSEDIDSENEGERDVNDLDSDNFQALGNLINSPTLLLKRDGTLCGINRAGEEFLNMSKETAVKQPISSLFIDIALMSTIIDLINRISSAKDGPKTEVISTQDGTSMKITAIPVQNSNGDFNNVIVQLTREEEK